MRHFAHNIGDYAAATAHLSFVEDAAYHRLLRRYYQDEKPLPGDVAACCRLVGARTPAERAAVAAVLGEFFRLEDDGYHQSRADREIDAYQEKAEAARRNGTKGGRPANRKITDPVSPSVRRKKLTTPHSPLPINQEPFCVANSESGSEAGRAAREPASRSTLIAEDWEPSEADVQAVRAEMPWIDDALFERRMRDFRDWCAANATRTFKPAATWRGFMRKTRQQDAAGAESFDERRIRLAREALRE